MCPCENPQKRRIIIQNGRQKEVAVIAYVTVPIATGYKKCNHAMAVKKEAWKNLSRQVSHEMNVEKSSILQMIGDQLKLTTNNAPFC